MTARASNRRQAHVTNAKYGDDGKYFDLNVSHPFSFEESEEWWWT